MAISTLVYLPLRPARAWSLHPQSSPTAVKAEKETERKPPKGVPLQFDINSVGKQVIPSI